MKRFLLIPNILVLIAITSGILLASVTLQYFTATTNSDGILLEWKTIEEGGTVKFEVQRSAVTPDNFMFIKSINATGNNSYYSYQDNSVGDRDGSSSSIYYYRLKCIQPNESYTYTHSISVIHAVSGIRSTWGSIKAIFR